MVLQATSVKLFTDSLFSYQVHNQLAFVFHPLNIALSFVNVFELKLAAVSYVILVSDIFPTHPLALYLIVYVIGVHWA